MKRSALLWIPATVLFVVVAMLLTLHWQEQRKRKELQTALARVQLALERFAVETEGAYPRDIGVLFERGYLAEMPLNPYSGEPMEVLQATDPPQAGAVVYVGLGPVIAVGNEAPAGDLILPTEIDHYLLAAYGPVSDGQREAFKARVDKWEKAHAGLEDSFFMAVVNSKVTRMCSVGGKKEGDIDYRDLVPAWELFECRLSAGNDHPL